jgi:pimeloyl-ACP methyl ester carboxylesterase
MNSEYFIRSFDNTEIYVTSTGHGMPIILSDGIGCDGFIWRYLKPFLKNRYRVIHWHYRGHGLTKSHHDASVDIASLRRDLLAVMDALKLDQALLLGHSMGSQLILDFAIHHAERVSGLVPLCGGYGRPLETFHDRNKAARIFPMIRDLILKFPRLSQTFWSPILRSSLAYFVATTFEVNGKLVQKADFEPYFQHLSTMDVRVFIRILDSLAAHTVEDRLSEIRVPTLIIAGEKDTFTPAWLSHRMEMLIPKAELLLVPGGTHTVPIEIPELVQLRLDKFLHSHFFSDVQQQQGAA